MKKIVGCILSMFMFCGLMACTKTETNYADCIDITLDDVFVMSNREKSEYNDCIMITVTNNGDKDIVIYDGVKSADITIPSKETIETCSILPDPRFEELGDAFDKDMKFDKDISFDIPFTVENQEITKTIYMKDCKNQSIVEQ